MWFAPDTVIAVNWPISVLGYPYQDLVLSCRVGQYCATRLLHRISSQAWSSHPNHMCTLFCLPCIYLFIFLFSIYYIFYIIYIYINILLFFPPVCIVFLSFCASLPGGVDMSRLQYRVISQRMVFKCTHLSFTHLIAQALHPTFTFVHSVFKYHSTEQIFVYYILLR